MTRWDRFWFPAGARLGLGVTRIGVALAVLWSLWRLHEPDFLAVLARQSADLYDPVGILRLLGSSVPPASLLTAIQIIAWISTLAMLLGLLSRASTIVSLVTALALASFQVSFAPGWHHTYPLVFLAQIPLAFAPVGDVLSLDNAIRRMRGLPPIQRASDSHAWAIQLVQFGVALVFFNALVHKLLQGHGSLAWAWSDNLRHQLLMRFDWIGTERTALADWLIQSPVRYKTAAALNLLSQLLPLLACFMWRRPRLRFLFGSFIVFETLGIGLVMNMWNLQWLPITVAFVDWDRLVTWIRARFGHLAADSPAVTEPMPRNRRRRVTAWIALYMGTWLVIGFAYPPIDHKANLFPFSRFPMFSVIRAKKPYSRHHSYEVIGSRIEVVSTPPISPERQAWIDRKYNYRWLHRVTDPAKLERRLASVARELTTRFRLQQVDSVTLWVTIFQAPAYPAKAELVEHRVAISGLWQADGSFESYLSTLDVDDVHPDRGAIRPTRPLPEDARFVYHRNDDPEPIPLVLDRDGDRLRYREVDSETQLFVVLVPRADGPPRPYTLIRAPRFQW